MKAPGLDGASRPFRQDWLGETPGRRPPHNPKTPLKNPKWRPAPRARRRTPRRSEPRKSRFRPYSRASSQFGDADRQKRCCKISSHVRRRVLLRSVRPDAAPHAMLSREGSVSIPAKISYPISSDRRRRRWRCIRIQSFAFLGGANEDPHPCTASFTPRLLHSRPLKKRPARRSALRFCPWPS